MIEKIKDHLKDRSKKAALPYPNINIIETNISAIPCSCFFILFNLLFSVCLCVITYLLSDDFIATTFCPVTLMIVSCLHLGQYRGKFSSTVSGRTLIRVLLLQIGHSTHFSFSNAPPPYYLISQTGSDLAFAKPLPIYTVRLCVYASGSDTDIKLLCARTAQPLTIRQYSRCRFPQSQY